MESTELVLPRSGPLQQVWSLLREGLRGSNRDFTEGPVGHAVLVLAIPMVMEMSMESLFAVVDVFFVSKLGATAVATVGLTESLLTIVYSVAMALCIGATATVARRIGEKDAEGASIAAVQVIAVGLIVSVALGLVGSLNARWFLAKMGADAAVLGPSATFSVIMLGGSGSVMMLFLMNAIFRAAGDATVAMRVLWLANAINLVLDPCLIFGLGPFPELGVVGAAVATTTGRTTAVVIQLVLLFSGRRRIAVAARHLKLVPSAMWTVCRLSGTGLLQILISTSSWIGLVRVISMFGSPALAGYTIGHPHDSVRAAAVMGTGQCRGDDGGAGAGGGEAGACGAGGVDGLLLQSRVPRHDRHDLRRVHAGHRRHLHERPGDCSIRCGLLACGEPRVRVLRLRHGADAVVQRRRRYVDADRGSTSAASGCGRSRWPGCWPCGSGSARPASISP